MTSLKVLHFTSSLLEMKGVMESTPSQLLLGNVPDIWLILGTLD